MPICYVVVFSYLCVCAYVYACKVLRANPRLGAISSLCYYYYYYYYYIASETVRFAVRRCQMYYITDS